MKITQKISFLFNSIISGFSNNKNTYLLNESMSNSKTLISISINSKIPLSDLGIIENKSSNNEKRNIK